MSRLLILGADPFRLGAFRAWKSAAYDLVLVDGNSQARYEQLADEFHAWDVRDGDSDIARLIDLAGSADGVVTLSDRSQLTAATVAAAAGLRSPGVNAARLARSKVEQRNDAMTRDVPVPVWAEVRSDADLATFFSSPARSAVLKPCDASASTAVYRVNSLDEARHRWHEVRRFSPSSTGIIEEFIEGREVSVEAVVAESECVRLAVTDKESGGATGFVEISHLVGCDVQEELHEHALNAINGLIKAWRIESGVVHAEFKARPSAWILIEAAVRPAGDFIPELVEKAWGWNIYDLQAQLALGKPILPACPQGRSRFAGVRFLAAEGTPQRFVPPAEVMRNLAAVHIVNQTAQPGVRVRMPTANWGRAGYAIGWGNDRTQLEMELRRAIEMLAASLGLRMAQP